ncbi:MAG: phosphoribosylamine--glycine ligase [Methanomassiliicoccales archaeon]
MKIVIVGGGAREHVIAEKLYAQGHKIYYTSKRKNIGMEKCASLSSRNDERDAENIAAFALKCAADLVIIGPEDPLEAGVSDAVEKVGIPCYGPTKGAARIETSKKFTRKLMDKYHIEGNPRHAVFENEREAVEFVQEADFPLVVKPSGLTGGKGVKVEGVQLSDRKASIEYVKELFRKNGSSDGVVIEERLEGEEFSLQAACDGKHLYPFPLVQDHKRAFEEDKGPNTGGMGSYSMKDGLLPFIERKDMEHALEIMKKAVTALKKEGYEFRGTLYGGFIYTASGVKLLEFNARFGDPEAMNVIAVSEGDIGEFFMGAACGEIGSKLTFRKLATLCRYFVPIGYGAKPVSGAEISVDNQCVSENGCSLYFASLEERNGKILTTSSRSLALLGVAEEPWLAVHALEAASHCVSGLVYSRKDIGTREEIELKRKRGEMLRGSGNLEA